MRESLLIRADGSARIGTGHVMRCLALAQSWQQAGGRAIFAQAASTPALERRLRQEGFETTQLDAEPGGIEDGVQTLEQARTFKASWIVADGYRFGTAWQKQIKDAGQRLLLIDDYGHAEHYSADWILNQNLHAVESLYACREPHTHLLLGTRYALLRQEFLAWKNWQREMPAVARKVLVTLGGSDPDNVTGKVIEALAGLRNLEAVVAIGGSNQNIEAIRAAIRNGGTPVRLVEDAANMPELMAWADVAVAAGGTTSWELAFMGLPALILVLAPNQSAVTKALEERGVAHNLGLASENSGDRIALAIQTLSHDSERRCALSRAGGQYVDGLGSRRVSACLGAPKVEVRRAQPDDRRQLWEWANDPVVRRASFNSAPIPWEAHVAWFEGKMSDRRCALLIGRTEQGEPLGQVRFEWDDAGAAEAHVSLAADWRGLGLASRLIERAVRELFQSTQIQRVVAHVKPDNAGSIRAFEAAGFRPQGCVQIKGCEALELVQARPAR